MTHVLTHAICSLFQVLQRIRAEAAVKAATDAGYSGRQTVPGSASSKSPMKSTAAVAAATSVTSATLRLPQFPIPALQQLVTRHFRSTRAPELVAGGQRPLALVYLLVATLVAAPLRQTVVVVDAEARFDIEQLLGMQPRASALDGSSEDVEIAQSAQTTQTRNDSHALSSPVTADDLQHVHVFRADPRWRVPLSELVAAAEQRVLYAGQRRRDRPWWGTVVVGCASNSGTTANDTKKSGESGLSAGGNSTLGHGTGAALATGPYGWLRIDRQEKDLASTLRERQRQLVALLEGVDLDVGSQERAAVGTQDQHGLNGIATFEPVTWVASSPWGGFTFQLSKPTL